MRALHSILRSVGVRNFVFTVKKFQFPLYFVQFFLRLQAPRTIGHRLTCECCFIFVSLHFIFSFLAFYAYMQKKQIWLYPPQSVFLIYCKRTSRKFFPNPCLLFFLCFTSLCQYMGHEPSTYNNIFNFTPCGISFT